MTASSGQDSGQHQLPAFSDPVYREAVIDLLAAIGYGEISAFERLTADAQLAPTLEDKVALATMASRQLLKVEPVRVRLSELGASPYVAMEPFRAPFDSFHVRTAPSNWYEGLIKAYVGDGLANDFYREIAAYLDTQTRELVLSTLEDEGQADFVVDRVVAAIARDHRLSGRLALWGRRLMGEALTQAQRVAADRDSLSALLAGSIDMPGLDLASIGRMFARLTERHTDRMVKLGLEH